MFDVRTPMRDGVELSSDVWLPDADGKYPVILVRLPYIKTTEFLKSAEFGAYFARHGYAYVVQDTRGRGDSDGKFDFYFPEAKDGYDSIEWLARQPWSNGRVCMMGVSYLATVQWLAAKEKPPHLVCIAPTSPNGRYLDEAPTIGGAFLMSWALHWIDDTSGRISEGADAAATDWTKVYAHRPLLTMDEALGRRMPLYRNMLAHDTLDDYWKPIQLGPDDFSKIDIPVMTYTGWFDGDQTGALYYWQGMHARKGGARDEYLVIGPWTHIQSYLGGSEKIGDLDLAKDAVIDNKAMHLAFFDHYLKQSTDRLDWPNVRVYVTGANVWRSFDAWPVPGGHEARIYLTSGGRANTADGDGALEWSAASGAPDAYAYDPKSPVPMELDYSTFAGDRRKVEGRQDVLVYTSKTLDKPVEIIGEAAVELYAASDARDTDFVATISDVQPNGEAILLGSRPVGAVRARYRNGRSATPQLLTPGEVVRYRIQLGAIGHAFLPGHRIRIDISSSASPMYNPNQNTGNPIATDTEWKTAHQRIFHDKDHPSALVLPIAPPN
ncbi:MAG: CocE/NonD family hydrolase [Caulobacteraceae bacterium]